MTEVGSKVNLRWVTAENNENNFVTRSKKKVEQKTNHLIIHQLYMLDTEKIYQSFDQN